MCVGRGQPISGTHVLVADFAETVLFLMIPVVLIVGVIALIVSGMAVTPQASPFVRLVQAGIALVLAVDALLLILYARGRGHVLRRRGHALGARQPIADQPSPSR